MTSSFTSSPGAMVLSARCCSVLGIDASNDTDVVGGVLPSTSRLGVKITVLLGGVEISLFDAPLSSSPCTSIQLSYAGPSPESP